MRGLRFSKATLAKVIAFAAVSAVFTVGLALKIGNLRLFAHQYRLQAVFSDASGVFKGDAVKLAGVDVGRVQGAKIDSGRAVVAFTVDDSVHLPADTVAAVRWRNVLGQRFLYLYPGTARGRFLQDGATIPMSQTEDAGDLGQFLNELGPILRAIDPAKANAFLDAMNVALAGDEPAVRQLLNDGAFLAGRLGSMDDQVKSLVGSSDQVMAAYASQQRAIAAILDDLNAVGGRLRGMNGDVDTLLVNFADVQQQLHTLLSQNRGNIDATLADLRAVTGNLSADRAQLARTKLGRVVQRADRRGGDQGQAREHRGQRFGVGPAARAGRAAVHVRRAHPEGGRAGRGGSGRAAGWATGGRGDPHGDPRVRQHRAVRPVRPGRLRWLACCSNAAVPSASGTSSRSRSSSAARGPLGRSGFPRCWPARCSPSSSPEECSPGPTG
ncbi:MAG: MCE family protein [Actinobacteria bacterium]|nr:MAG: MCE family protein [Actinomycetota bacterium]